MTMKVAIVGSRKVYKQKAYTGVYLQAKAKVW